MEPELTLDQNTRPLPTVDRLIVFSRTAKPDSKDFGEIPTKLAESILACLNMPQREWRVNPLSAMFSNSLPLSSRRLIAACLVRLWCSCPDLFSDNVTFRNLAISLLDNVFGAEFYPRLKIREKSQTYEKSAALSNALTESEENLQAAAELLTGIETAQTFERAFFGVYNRPSTTALIAPFLPRHELHSKLHRVTTRIETYSTAPPSEVVAAYEAALATIDERITEARDCGTHYAHEFLVVPFSRLRDHLVKSFETSPLRQDASFRMTRSDKKYAFHSLDTTISLEVEIENIGPGYASDLQLNVRETTAGRPIKTLFEIGDMPPSKRMLAVDVVFDSAVSEVFADLELTWLTFDRQPRVYRTTLEFTAQRCDIDWQSLSTAEPYDVEPISDDSQLIGRTEILHQLIGMATAASLGSAIVHGQKRVGKTSIVKALQSKLARADNSLNCIYVLVGDYVRPDPIRSIQALGTRLCEEIKHLDGDLADLTIPSFEDALAPLGDFIRAVQRKRERRFLFILDEFDELPTDLYSHNEIANAFFLGLRSLSARSEIGFILVGSERMSAILSFQGQNLNKFKSIKVDYFDRQNHWSDFTNLVRQPSDRYLEFSDRAVELIYSYTAGNPYFTKLICKSILKIMVNRRDAHVTGSEVQEACTTELRNIDINSFVHFWEDGIVEKGVEREKIFLTRRKVLLAFGEVLRRTSGKVTIQQVQLAAKDYELTAELVKAEVEEFAQRQVFEQVAGIYSIKVKFFAEWLREYGVTQILSRLTGRIAGIERRVAEAAYVRGDEILQLVKRINVYKGTPITADTVRTWLQQFGAETNQRLMFKLLQSVRFFSEYEIRKRLSDLHAIIAKEIGLPLRHGTGRIEHLAISYLDGIGKSGYQYARLYSEENKIVTRNIVEMPKLPTVFLQADVRAVLWIDDFVGTGSTIIKHFEEHSSVLHNLQKQHGLRYFVGVIAGLQEAQSGIEDAVRKLGIRIEVRICDPLSARDQCFSAESKVFDDEDERVRAQRLAEDFGRRVVSRYPLGFGGCGMCVVFERSCPNNTLPIFWGNSNGWNPIFPR